VVELSHVVKVESEAGVRHDEMASLDGDDDDIGLGGIRVKQEWMVTGAERL
jgi:hypothetical protein